MASPGLTRTAGAGGGEETLESLLEASRNPEGRSRLASLVPALLRHLRPGLPLLLPTLRLLRNLCAGEPAAQGAFLEAGGPGAVASVFIGGGGAGAPPVSAEVSRVGLQLLGNVAVAGERGQRGVWDTMFPEGLLALARVRDAGACDALCMVLRSCCCSAGEGSHGRLEELCGVGRGLLILKEVLTTACSDEYRGDWLKLLLSRICFEESYFPLLFSMFSLFNFSGSQINANCQDIHFTTEQAFLLGLLSEILSEHFYRGTVSIDFALVLFHILKGASSVVDFNSRGTSPLPTGLPVIDVLGYSLTILRDICASDDSSWSASDGLVDSLVSSGLCQFLLSLLRDLEPPLIIMKTLSQRVNKESPSVSTCSSKVCPYKGFRREIVAVIGNCTCGRKHVQDEIRQQNGILLLLQQCVIDEDNPYLREWGMLTMSYLLKGNMENQQQVAELKLQESIDTPEISNLGLKVDVDEKSGRVKLVNV